MKKFILFLIGVISIQATRAQIAFTDAVEYNDYIVNEQTAVGNAILELSAAFNEEGDMESYKNGIWRKYDALKIQAASSLEKINLLPVYDGNTEFLESVKAIFIFYQQVIANEYSQLIYFMTNENATQEDQDNMMKMMDTMSQQEALLDSRFLSAQQAFADKYGFMLEENELQEAIDGEDE